VKAAVAAGSPRSGTGSGTDTDKLADRERAWQHDHLPTRLWPFAFPPSPRSGRE
jgi:hypothetical protein